MKIIISLCISILILSGCGKKSAPEYKGKIHQSKIIL